jgi:hypothetical protein
MNMVNFLAAWFAAIRKLGLLRPDPHPRRDNLLHFRPLNRTGSAEFHAVDRATLRACWTEQTDARG